MIQKINKKPKKSKKSISKSLSRIIKNMCPNFKKGKLRGKKTLTFIIQTSSKSYAAWRYNNNNNLHIR